MENNHLQRRIDAYFAALEAPLVDVPNSRRSEFVDEARSHLSAMVEARRADGMDEARAWEGALQEFGEPEQIGRALHRQWASSGQLESEGAPLSARDVARKFGVRAIFSILMALAISVVGSPLTWHGPWIAPCYALFFAIALGWGLWRWRRDGGQWTASSVMSVGFAVVVILCSVGVLQWGEGWASSVFEAGNGVPLTVAFLGFFALQKWLYRREMTRRPWQFASRFRNSPVAAEQEYRLSPLFGAAFGLVGAVLMFWLPGVQVFGISASWPVAALLIDAILVCGWWPRRAPSA